MNTVRLNVGRLRTFKSRLEELNKRSVKVGLLASTATRVPVRRDEIPDNPSVGVRHEFGLGTPRRSFLEMPLTQHLGDTIQKDDSDWGSLILNRNVKGALHRLGKLGVKTVREAFNTGGWGQWPPLAAITVHRKIRNKNRILIETTQMRDAITSEVT